MNSGQSDLRLNYPFYDSFPGWRQFRLDNSCQGQYGGDSCTWPHCITFSLSSDKWSLPTQEFPSLIYFFYFSFWISNYYYYFSILGLNSQEKPLAFLFWWHILLRDQGETIKTTVLLEIVLSLILKLVNVEKLVSPE